MFPRRPLRAVAFGVLCLAGACAPQKTWIKPDATPEQFEADRNQCEVWSIQNTAFPRTPAGQQMLMENFQKCMTAKGYVLGG